MLLSLTASLAMSAAPEKLPAPPLELKVWEGAIPGGIKNTYGEKEEPGDRVQRVGTPMIDVYIPPADKANGMAIIVCSGGGYTRLASRPLGYYAAEKFGPLGIAVFSLKYRLKPPSIDVRKDALADLRETIRIVRHRAAEWHIDPNRIVVIGFSAGAHLTLNLATHPDDGDLKSAAPLARLSCRPNAIGLFSTWSGGDKIETFSVNAQSPPAYISHAANDNIAPVAFAEEVVAAWKKAGSPVKDELYDSGGHEGFNFPNKAHSNEWPDKFLTWLTEQGVYKPTPAQ